LDILCHEKFAGEERKPVRVRLPDSLVNASAKDIIAAYVEQSAPEGVDIRREIARAVQAVRDGRVIFLWNNSQITDMNARLPFVGDNEATFIHLIPLRGG